MQHAIYSGKLAFKALLFFFQTLDLFCEVNQLCKWNVKGCVRDHNGYRVLCDASLVRLTGHIGCARQGCKEQLALLEGILQLFLVAYDINVGFSGGRNVHAGADVADAADSFLEDLDLLLFFLEVSLLLINRPGGNHDGFLFGLQGAENFFCNKRHIRMQQF